MRLLIVLLYFAPVMTAYLGDMTIPTSNYHLAKRSCSPAEGTIVHAKDYLGLVKKASGNAVKDLHTPEDNQWHALKMSKWLTRAQGSVFRHKDIARMNQGYYTDKLNRCETQDQLDRTIGKNGSWVRLIHLQPEVEVRQLVDSAMSRFADDAEQYRILLARAQALPASQAIQIDLNQRMEYAKQAATLMEREDAEEAATLTKRELAVYAQLIAQGNGADDPQHRWRLVDSATKAIALHMRTQELYRLDEERQSLVRLPGTKRRRPDDDY